MTQENKAKMRVILNMVDTLFVEVDEIAHQEAKAFENLSDTEKQSKEGEEMKRDLNYLLVTRDDFKTVLDDFYHYFR
jgi:hypothetical protein